MSRFLLVLVLAVAMPAPALATEWGVAFRSAFRHSSGMETGRSPITYTGASFVDQSIVLTGYPHQALGLTADIARYVPLLRLEGATAPAQEIWQGGAGLMARADLGPCSAEAQLGYGLAQVPSVIRGPGTPSLLHGPRFGLGLAAALPAGFGVSARATVLLPFVSFDGRGDRGDGDAFELRLGLEKWVASVAGKNVGIALDVRRRIDSTRALSGAPLSRLVSDSVGLSLSVAGITEGGR